MPTFRLSKAFSVGRGTKLFLNLQGGLIRGKITDLEYYENQTENLESTVKEQRTKLEKLRNERQHDYKQMTKLRRELRRQRLESSQLRNELNAVNEMVDND